MNKKTVHSAVFFTILYWLLFYMLVIKRHLIVKEISLVPLVVAVGINLVLILCAGLLVPVFEAVLRVTQKIGALIFGLITTVVYVFVLTPIALFKRWTGGKLMDVGMEKDKESYYEAWEPSASIEKQF